MPFADSFIRESRHGLPSVWKVIGSSDQLNSRGSAVVEITAALLANGSVCSAIASRTIDTVGATIATTSTAMVRPKLERTSHGPGTHRLFLSFSRLL